MIQNGNALPIFFTVSKTGRPPKWDNNVQCNYVACGSAWKDDILLTKVFTVDFANGEMMIF